MAQQQASFSTFPDESHSAAAASEEGRCGEGFILEPSVSAREITSLPPDALDSWSAHCLRCRDSGKFVPQFRPAEAAAEEGTTAEGGSWAGRFDLLAVASYEYQAEKRQRRGGVSLYEASRETGFSSSREQRLRLAAADFLPLDFGVLDLNWFYEETPHQPCREDALEASDLGSLLLEALRISSSLDEGSACGVPSSGGLLGDACRRLLGLHLSPFQTFKKRRGTGGRDASSKVAKRSAGGGSLRGKRSTRRHRSCV